MRSLPRRFIRVILVALLLLTATTRGFSDSSHESTSQLAQHGVALAEDGKQLGSVVDLIVDLPTGRVLYAAVIPTRTWLKTTSVVLLPWHLAQVDASGSIFVFKLAADTIRHIPPLPKKRWPQRLSHQWFTRVEKYWQTQGVEPVQHRLRSKIILSKATALIGVRVQGADQSKVGTIRELVFDPRDHTIATVILARPGDSADPHHLEFISVPWEQLYVEQRGNVVIAISGHKTLT